jgi:hypothetical protein
MPKGVTTKNDVLQLILWGTSPGWRTNANGYLALHVADPSAGTQSTSPATYTPYARMPITRDSNGWEITADTAQNKNQVQFAICASGSDTITHVSYGETLATAGQIYYCGALSPSIPVAAPIQPQVAIHGITIVEG